MNNGTTAHIRKAIDELLLAQFSDDADLTNEEHERVCEIANELTALITPKYIVTLEGWYWQDNERVYVHLDDLHSYPCEQAAVDECDELADDERKLVLAACSNNFCEGTALAVYERRGSESRPIQMYVLEHGRPNEFYWGADAEHVAL